MLLSIRYINAIIFAFGKRQQLTEICFQFQSSHKITFRSFPFIKSKKLIKQTSLLDIDKGIINPFDQKVSSLRKNWTIEILLLNNNSYIFSYQYHYYRYYCYQNQIVLYIFIYLVRFKFSVHILS